MTRTVAFALIVTLVACGEESPPLLIATPAPAFAYADPAAHLGAWSEPVNVGPPVNTSSVEQAASLSPDGRSLYFNSSRTDLPGVIGGGDIWVSRRDCDDCSWQTPVNLGPGINSELNDGGPELSPDGHLLFFQSPRDGSADIYVSRRSDPNDDLAWGPPVRLGPEVNTPAFEAQPRFAQSAEDGSGNLYFSRGPTGSAQDVYYVAISRDGVIRGPVVLVPELSDPAIDDGSPALRADGREIFFHRAVGTARLLFTATRRSVHEPWSAPVALGVPMNDGTRSDQPSLTFDGRTLVFTSVRPGGEGVADIWIATRKPGGY